MLTDTEVSTMLNQLSPCTVKEVYNGKPGCMCGCKGRYSSNPSSIQRTINTLQENTNTQFDKDARCFYLETDTKMHAVYLKEG